MRILSLLIVVTCLCSGNPARADTEFAYTSIDELRRQLDSGETSSARIAASLLERIETIDQTGPAVNAIIEVNPEALAIAEALDKERKTSGPRGPLHGIPVVLKANIDTGDKMASSAGSLALASHFAKDDAQLVADLRAAGMLILAKANLSEWANFRSSASVSGWSSLGGQTRNPHVLDRNACGSSSGSAAAVAAGLSPLAVGTETDGSIICPASINGIVGVKPTVGLISRDGIIPIAHTQDTAGPMARSVFDAALLLNVLATKDTKDQASASHPGQRDYTRLLDKASLRGKTIGIWRGYYGANDNAAVKANLDQTVALMKKAGAKVKDIELDLPDGINAAEYEVLLYEFKAGLNAYLSEAGVDPSVASLQKLIAYNKANADRLMPWFGQEIFELAQTKNALDDPAYQKALKDSHVAMKTVLHTTFKVNNLDALMAPSNGPAWPIDYVAGDRFSVGSSSLAAVSGWPSVTLPAGSYRQLPLGVSLIARPWTEDRLLALAFALEQILPKAKKPGFTSSLEQPAER
ncbi:MAG: amidase [Pseudomonadota bacterium]